MSSSQAFDIPVFEAVGTVETTYGALFGRAFALVSEGACASCEAPLGGASRVRCERCALEWQAAAGPTRAEVMCQTDDGHRYWWIEERPHVS